MFDRFTDRARKVMGLARQESQRFCHDYIGPEHMLLGLIQEGSGVAADVLKGLDVDPKKIRRAIEKGVKRGKSMITMGQIPFTPSAKRVLESALAEASRLGHNYIGREHLLLGVIRDGSGASDVLAECGVELEAVREEILELLGAEVADDVDADPARGLNSLILESMAENALLERLVELEERVKKLEERLGDD